MKNDVLLDRAELSSKLYWIQIDSFKVLRSFNKLCGLSIYFLSYDRSECTRVASVVVCSWECRANVFCSGTRRGRDILGARPGSLRTNANKEKSASHASSEYLRKRINTRSSGDAERLPEEAEHSSGDNRADERGSSSAWGDERAEANARRARTIAATTGATWDGVASSKGAPAVAGTPPKFTS